MTSKEKSNQESLSPSLPQKRDPQVSKYSGKPIQDLLKEITSKSKSQEVALIVRGIQETLNKVSGSSAERMRQLESSVPYHLDGLRYIFQQLTLFCEDFVDHPQSSINHLHRADLDLKFMLGQIYEDIYHKGYADGYQNCLEAQSALHATRDLSRLGLDLG